MTLDAHLFRGAVSTLSSMLGQVVSVEVWGDQDTPPVAGFAGVLRRASEVPPEASALLTEQFGLSEREGVEVFLVGPAERWNCTWLLLDERSFKSARTEEVDHPSAADKALVIETENNLISVTAVREAGGDPER